MKKYVVALALCALSVGCKKKDAPVVDDAPAVEVPAAEAPADATPEAAAPADATAAALAELGELTMSNTIVLVDAGAAPRSTLRFDLSSIEPMRQDVVVEVSMKMGGIPEAAMDMAMPPMRTTVELRDVQSENDGLSVTLHSSTPIFETDPSNPTHQAIAQAMKEQGDAASTARMHIDARGNITLKGIEMANEENQQLASQTLSSLNAMVMTFPEEAVGAGARWTTTTSVSLGEMGTIRMDAHYTLVERKGNTVVLDFEMDQDDFMSLVADPAFHVTSSKLVGKGQSTLDLSSMFATGTMTMTMAMDLAIEGQAVTSTTTLKTQTLPATPIPAAP